MMHQPCDPISGLHAFDSFFDRLFEVANECVSPWEGVAEGQITWSEEGGVRQVYLLEESAETPSFPPSQNKPDGTVWPLYVDPDSDPIASGMLTIGEIPSGTRQVLPEDGSPPALVDGRTYRLFATPDFQLIRKVNCTFVYQAPDSEQTQ